MKKISNKRVVVTGASSGERWSGLFEQQKGFLSNKLFLFKTSAAALLPVIGKIPTSKKMHDFNQLSILWLWKKLYVLFIFCFIYFLDKRFFFDII